MAYIITSSWSLIRFTEKDITSKLDVLLRKSLYPLAITLATEESCDIGDIMKIYQLYGDFLFRKGDYDGAIAQYSATVGFVQPSYVIKRFLESNLVSHLVTYLEKIHERGVATKDHTVLLLSCLTKMKDESKLAEFLNMLESKENEQGSVSDSFDIEVAITTLYQFGCEGEISLKFFNMYLFPESMKVYEYICCMPIIYVCNYLTPKFNIYM